MREYLEMLRDVLENGEEHCDRTGTGTRSVFGRQIRFDLSQGFFPLLTTKKLHLRSIIVELLWFLRGDTNTAFLHDHGVSIWDEWADANGELGPIYGKQWRSWTTPDGEIIDQMARVAESIKKEPYSRRHVVLAWNPADIGAMALPPCHCLFQFRVGSRNGKDVLDCQLYQRSADIFLGVPFNIASYALLTMLMARATDLSPGELIHCFGDLHLYRNHKEQAKEQLTRTPGPLPTMRLRPDKHDLFGWEYADFELCWDRAKTGDSYTLYSNISADIAV